MGAVLVDAADPSATVAGRPLHAWAGRPRLMCCVRRPRAASRSSTPWRWRCRPPCCGRSLRRRS